MSQLEDIRLFNVRLEQVKKKLMKDIKLAKRYGYTGIDIAIDNIDNNVYTQENRDSLYECIKNKYPDARYDIDFDAIKVGYCGHHISINF